MAARGGRRRTEELRGLQAEWGKEPRVHCNMESLFIVCSALSVKGGMVFWAKNHYLAILRSREKQMRWQTAEWYGWPFENRFPVFVHMSMCVCVCSCSHMHRQVDVRCLTWAACTVNHGATSPTPTRTLEMGPLFFPFLPPSFRLLPFLPCVFFLNHFLVSFHCFPIVLHCTSVWFWTYDLTKRQHSIFNYADQKAESLPSIS